MIFLKKNIFNICSISICILAIVISVINLKSSKIDNVIQSNASSSNNIDNFIKDNEEMLLCIYDINITGEKLTSEQKEYITKIYILFNKDKYNEDIVYDLDEGFSIKYDIFNDAYFYLFSENIDNIPSDYVEIKQINVEKFHIDSRKIQRYSCINDTHVLEIEYITKFLEKVYTYNVKYNIGYKDGKYYLIGYVIN